MSLRIIIFTLAGIFMIVGISIFSSVTVDLNDEKGYLVLSNRQIELIVASTSETRTRGLSGMKSLPENSAMLFIFSDLDTYGIWMKDMKFPIDILWIDENKKIIHIEQNVSPGTYPTVFFPPQKSLYVIEVNAGFAQENALSVGNFLNFTR